MDMERTSELLNRKGKNMLKEINVIEALNRFLKDDDVKVLVPMGEVGEWENYQAMMLSQLFDGVVFIADGAPVHVREEVVKPKETEIVFADEPPIETDDTDPEVTEVTEVTEATEKTPKKRGPKPRGSVDYGKMRTLYETGGWKVPQIAEEMGLSQQFVYKALKEMGVDLTK